MNKLKTETKTASRKQLVSFVCFLGVRWVEKAELSRTTASWRSFNKTLVKILCLRHETPTAERWWTSCLGSLCIRKLSLLCNAYKRASQWGFEVVRSHRAATCRGGTLTRLSTFFYATLIIIIRLRDQPKRIVAHSHDAALWSFIKCSRKKFTRCSLLTDLRVCLTGRVRYGYTRFYLRTRKAHTTYCIWYDFFLQVVFLQLLSESLWSILKSIFSTSGEVHCVLASRRLKSTWRH